MGDALSPLADSADALRDRSEFALLRLALQRQMPVFGICRGHQLLNLALGGTLYQDLPSEFPADVLPHSQAHDKRKPAHEVTLAAGSLIARLLGKDRVPVNSLHHQAVRETAPALRAVAFSPDGVNEAIESPCYPVYGVQWHPEQLLAGGDDAMLPLFEHLVDEALLYRQARDFVCSPPPPSPNASKQRRRRSQRAMLRPNHKKRLRFLKRSRFFTSPDRQIG